MSIFKTNKFFRVIKHFILALPLMFVLGTSLYSIVNPNAKDSYYGETINEEIINNANDTLYLNVKYTTLFSENENVKDSSSYYSNYVPIDNLLDSSFTIIQGIFDKIIGFDFYNAGSVYNIRFHYYDDSDVLSYKYETYATSSSGTNKYIIYYVSNNTDISINFSNITTFISYNQYSYLNNAFEYGLYQFTQIGFGQFDFISLFDGIFTINLNNVYALFINDYINYYLFVEIVYFAPWVFHAFIHFAYDLGDYFTSSFKRNRKDDD